MTLYGIVLFLHILAAIGIVGGSCLEHYFHVRMRRARTMDALTEWLSAMKTISALMPIFAVILLVCGAYMTFAHWNWQQPWIVVSLALLIGISVLAPSVLAPNLRAVARAASSGASLSAVADLLEAPLPNIAGGVFTGEALAIVLLMATKPSNLVLTLAIVLIAAGVGAFAGRPRARASAHVVEADSSGAEVGVGRTR